MSRRRGRTMAADRPAKASLRSRDPISTAILFRAAARFETGVSAVGVGQCPPSGRVYEENGGDIGPRPIAAHPRPTNCRFSSRLSTRTTGHSSTK